MEEEGAEEVQREHQLLGISAKLMESQSDNPLYFHSSECFAVPYLCDIMRLGIGFQFVHLLLSGKNLCTF